MKNELTAERYRSAFDSVHASGDLLERVKKMKAEKCSGGRKTVLRRVSIAAAAVIVLLVLSNLVALAATGGTWVERIFWYDEKPNQPMDNVRSFFTENGGRFGTDPSTARRDYYGGTYLDGGMQVILLTDLSRVDAFTGVGDNIRFEKCDYTYAQLTGAIGRLDEIIPAMIRRGEGGAQDVVGWGLNDKENRVFVTILHISDEKIAWFRENVMDEEYLVFENAEAHDDLD